MALLRSVKPNLARIAFLADNSVSDRLIQTNTRAAQEAGLRPHIVHISGAAPDLTKAFFAMQREGTEALVDRDHPVNGANAASIAKLALAHCMPTVVARSQADAGGFLVMGPACARGISNGTAGKLYSSWHRSQLPTGQELSLPGTCGQRADSAKP